MARRKYPRPVERMPASGGAVWALPGSVWEVMWIGPGAGLFFGQPRKAGGTVTRIRHRTADATYRTLDEAGAAFAAFLAACEEAEAAEA